MFLFLFPASRRNFNPRPPRGGRRRRSLPKRPTTTISIHALREEGDGVFPAVIVDKRYDFNPRPPRGGRPASAALPASPVMISIHALREEGDESGAVVCRLRFQFQSTPSARRATKLVEQRPRRHYISIHALREEGDLFLFLFPASRRNFNPRPPRGGRQGHFALLFQLVQFQSTPSARRATAKAAKKSNAFVPLYTLVHNLKRNFTKAPAK